MLFHSIAAAAGALGVPTETLRQAKRAGASGFRSNGNLAAGELLAWLLTRGRQFKPRMSLEQAKALLTEAQTKALLQKASVESGDLAETKDIKRALRLLPWALAISIRKSLHDLAAMSGTDPQVAHAIAGTLHIGFCDSLASVAAAACGNLNLPDWAMEAFRTGAQTGFRDDPGDFQHRAELFGTQSTEFITKRLWQLGLLSGEKWDAMFIPPAMRS